MRLVVVSIAAAFTHCLSFRDLLLHTMMYDLNMQWINVRFLPGTATD